MKRSLAILLVATMSILSAQDVVEKKVGEFTKLKVYDLINVEMIKSDVNKAVIKGEDRYDVEFVNRNGTLKIRMSPENSYDGDDTYIALYYTEVDIIDANEGSRIIVRDLIDQYEIDLKTQEGGRIEAELKVTYANMRAVTGGIVNASGAAKNQDVSVYTGGIFEGKNLVTEFSEVSIHAGGEIEVNCTDRLEINIKAGGDVYVYGNPKAVDEKRVFGGRVKHMD